MAVELLAARMIAPHFGSSLYVWATVIGFTLLALAIGYFAGGVICWNHEVVVEALNLNAALSLLNINSTFD